MNYEVGPNAAIVWSEISQLACLIPFSFRVSDKLIEMLFEMEFSAGKENEVRNTHGWLRKNTTKSMRSQSNVLIKHNPFFKESHRNLLFL